VKHDNGARACGFNAFFQALVGRYISIVVVCKDIPHHNFVGREELYLCSCNTTVGWAKKAGGTLGQFVLTPLDILDVSIIFRFPAIQVVESVISYPMSFAKNSFENIGVALDIIANTEKSRLCLKGI
jgi:hypothetical protein